MKILLVILLTGGLIVGVSYAGNRYCERDEKRCLKSAPDTNYLTEHRKAKYMNSCMKRFPQYDYEGKKCNY